MAETTLTVGQIMDLGLWEKVCDYKGWEYWIVNEGKIQEDELVTFDSEFKREEENPFNEPHSLNELIEELESVSVNKDFSDQYIIDNDLVYPSIGEFTYGTSYVPCSWVLPYLYELRKLQSK